MVTAPQEPLTLATVVGDAPAFTFQADGLKRPPLIAVRTADEKQPWRIVWETGPHGRYRDLDHMENDYLLYGPGPINLDTVAPLGPLHPARDDAAHLEAELSKWWSAYVEVAGFLGMVSTDDTGRIGAVAGMEEVLAELEQRERDAAELRAALTKMVDQVGYRTLDWAGTVCSGCGADQPNGEHWDDCVVLEAEAALAASEGSES